MDYKEMSDAMLKGTTTVGIVCSDGIILGSDSRSTADTFISSENATKIFKIDEGLAMTTAGAVGDLEYLVKLLKMQSEFYKLNEKKPLSPAAASSVLSLVLQDTKYMPYIVQLIIAGLNNGTPELYDLDPFGGVEKQPKFYSTGSGSLTALGYIEGIYSEALTVQDAVKHVAKALQVAMKRDSATGGGMKIVTITKKGYKEYSKDEIDKVSK